MNPGICFLSHPIRFKAPVPLRTYPKRRADRSAKHHRESGLTFVEIIVALFIFGIAVLCTLAVFRKQILELRARRLEYRIASETAEFFQFLDKHLPHAMVNDREGDLRMDFIGASDRLRFVAPFSEGEDSDLAKFGMYRDKDRIKIALARVDRNSPSYSFSEGFPGAQTLTICIEDFRISYADGASWQSSWDTRQGSPEEGRLPSAVSVELSVSPPEKMEGRRLKQRFTKTVNMEY